MLVIKLGRTLIGLEFRHRTSTRLKLSKNLIINGSTSLSNVTCVLYLSITDGLNTLVICWGRACSSQLFIFNPYHSGSETPTKNGFFAVLWKIKHSVRTFFSPNSHFIWLKETLRVRTHLILTLLVLFLFSLSSGYIWNCIFRRWILRFVKGWVVPNLTSKCLSGRRWIGNTSWTVPRQKLNRNNVSLKHVYLQNNLSKLFSWIIAFQILSHLKYVRISRI